MKYKLLGDNINIDDQMRELIRQKVLKPLDKLVVHFPQDMKEVEIKLHKKTQPGEPGFIVNFNMWLPGNEHIFAEKDGEEFAFVLTDLREAVEKQLKKYKEKISNK